MAPNSVVKRMILDTVLMFQRKTNLRPHKIYITKDMEIALEENDTMVDVMTGRKVGQFRFRECMIFYGMETVFDAEHFDLE